MSGTGLPAVPILSGQSRLRTLLTRVPTEQSSLVNGFRTAYIRPLSSVVSQASQLSQPQTPAASSAVSLLPLVWNFQTSAVSRDIDSAAKFIGAGAATVGVAGSDIASNAVHKQTSRTHEVSVQCYKKSTSMNREFSEEDVTPKNVPMKQDDDVKVSIPSPHQSYENESPVPQNPIAKLDLSKFYPANTHPFYLNANEPFPPFAPASSLPSGLYPPYFIPPPPQVLFPGNTSHDFVEMKEGLQKEFIRRQQLISGGSLALDQVAMANAADGIQSLHQQAMAEYKWRIENVKEDRTFSPILGKEKTAVHSESEKDLRNQEVSQSKLPDKLVLSKPKQDTSSSVKMVIKNGVLIPKRKQRRFCTEKSFSCEHCSSRFTLKYNMDRHIKQQHPQYWTQRQRNAISMPPRRNHSLSPKVPLSLLNHSQYYSHTGMPSIKSEEEKSKSSFNSDQPNIENKFSIFEGKACISEEVKNEIALQSKSKISPSEIPENENTNTNDDLVEEESDLISTLLGIQDKTIIDKILQSKSADYAAKLLGVQNQLAKTS